MSMMVASAEAPTRTGSVAEDECLADVEELVCGLSEGCEEVEDAVLGRMVRSARAFGVGSVLLVDEASLVWDEDEDCGHAAMLRAFLAASDEARRAVRTLYRPAGDAASGCVSRRRIVA